MIFLLKIIKGHDFVNCVGGVAILYFCTLSGHILYLYQVLRKYLNWLKIIEGT